MKTVVLLFSDEHLAYSPTVLNLMALLEPRSHLLVIAPTPTRFARLDHPNVRYVDTDRALTRRVSKYGLKKLRIRLGLPSSADMDLDRKTYSEVHSLRNALLQMSFDACIAVDPTCLWIAQSIGAKPHFLSLELTDRPLANAVDYSRIQSFCIQSPERMAAGAFGVINCPVFYVPNSTIFQLPPQTDRPPNHLLFCGTAIQGFGFYTCLHFLKENPNFYMTLQGTLPEDVLSDILKFWPELTETGQLIISDQYIAEADINRFVSQFRIGFCFYDLRIKYFNHANYRTAPSGKMWKYLAAGVPVIGIDIPGLSIIKDRNCGVLVSQLTSQAIKRAIDVIESDYAGFQRRALETAKEFSFDIHGAPYVEHLLRE